MDKSYRIHTNISSDTVLNVNMQQDFDFLEVLSLKLRQKDAYRLHSSNYGVIIGRVLANDAFGVPNAKVSIFIERDGNDSSDIEAIYPYKEVTTKDKEGRRYNLLPDYSDDDCYRVVGTFPNKRLMLDDDIQLEIYEKYWKYTTVTNNAGDYMLFGVPTGSVTVHIDIDLSDIGILSQKPRDFEYKGYNLTLFDSPNQFKESTNLDNLAQIFSQNKSVFVYPFWGDADNGIASLTRADIQIQYKFEPTCVFMGSIVSDNEGHAIGHKCAPDVENGMNDQLVGGSGTIEMIRKTTDGLIEEYQIKGNQLIDENGVWCYQIPMNLDYIGTDEYGNIVPTDNPTKGIPTRAQVRFRFSKNETNDEGFSRHTAKYLVPMNPIFSEEKLIPQSLESGREVEKMYTFGSATPISCFRDLYWNNVYSVKNYIPKTQVARRSYAKNYSALKGSNLATDQNPIPFNKLRIDIPFLYMVVCIIYTIMIWVVTVVNGIISFLHFLVYEFCLPRLPIIGKICPFKWLGYLLGDLSCITMSAGGDEGNVAYYPGCSSGAMRDSDCPEDMEGGCTKSASNDNLLDKIQRNLAQEFKIIKLDLYQDWINGCLYMPLWYWRKTKKKTFLFGLFSRSAKNEYCSDSRLYSRLKTSFTCNIEYDDNSLTTSNGKMPDGEKRWHKRRNGTIYYSRGLIKDVKNKNGLSVYYYAATQATSENTNENLIMNEREAEFFAIRLYATDIILLGNLNENNIYGIPQFYKCLPSTTANVPPIATIEEDNSEESDRVKGNDIDETQDSGTTITTGMDWNHDGDEQSPMYKTGLFMDLSCTYAATKPKSCINVERLSELGVSLDMTKRMDYRKSDSNDVQYGEFGSDGFINKLELDDTENRAMFATLNHIGFIPQEYQDSISGYTTQVQDKNTNYLIPKFKYIYPVDFDGRLEAPMDNYRNGSEEALGDVKDQSYITFRLGAESDSKKENNSEGRIRHFYEKYSMPLYNNSYYFYFGIKKGSTAIDKFNEMFDAPCARNSKKPFSFDVETHGVSYCPESYDRTKKPNAYGYIKVSSDDIRTPYTYTLYDSFGNTIISEDGMSTSTFTIGDVNDNGKIKYQLKDEDLEKTLKNQTYTIELIDADGRKMSEKASLEMPFISGSFVTSNLGTKFFSSGETRIDYVCSDESQFYGKITLSAVTIDGYECEITNASLIGYDADAETKEYKIELTLSTSGIGSGITAILLISSTKDVPIKECLCDKKNTIAVAQKATISIGDTIGENGFVRFKNNILTFFVYQPSDFMVTLIQKCDGIVLSGTNQSTSILTVKNGEPFEAYLNEMPLRFMLGTSNDNINAAVSNTSNFYRSTVVTNPSGHGLTGWYGVHKEDVYKYPKIDEQNKKIWKTFIKNQMDDITSVSSKVSILRYKFEKMFLLSEGTYITSASSKRFKYTTTGGVNPILYRSLVPMYKNQNKLLNGTYLFSDASNASMNESFPNIVGNNYSGVTTTPVFNPFIKVDGRVGNYFAAFTKDGGYSSKTNVDNTIVFEKRPVYTLVNPVRQVKQKGKTIETDISTYEKVYTKTGSTLPYFRAISIDRRLDYDITLLGPALDSDFNLYVDDKFKDDFWKGARICGNIYNGIEMAYDESYNIISANTEYDENGTPSGVSANTILEYSYSASNNSNSAITIYNNPASGYWGSWNIGYEPSIDDEKPLIKQLYTAEVNGSDIRNLVWSNFNKERLHTFITESTSSFTSASTSSFTSASTSSNDYYVFKYPYEEPSLYNGSFDMDNYPTKRFIDVGKLPASPYFSMELTSCAYGAKPALDGDGSINCEITEGDSLKFDVNLSKPITVLPPNAESTDYVNVNFKIASGSRTQRVVLSASTFSMAFRYNSFAVDDFTVYTKTPKIIKVLPYTEDYDGIGYIKTSHMRKESGIETSAMTFDDAIEKVKMVDITSKNQYIWFHFGAFVNKSFIQLPSDVDVSDDEYYTKKGVSVNGVFFKHGDDFLPSDDSLFTAIKFVTSIDLSESPTDLSESPIKALAVLVDREYESNDDDYLTKHIRSIEFSEIFDCRNLDLGVNSGKTYAELTVVSSSDTQVVTDIHQVDPPEDEEGDEEGGDEEGGKEYKPDYSTVSDSTKMYTQTIGFDMYFDTSGTTAISDRNNEAFANLDSMSYTFFFRDKNDNEYEISPQIETNWESGGTPPNPLIITFTCKWDSSMGILIDNQWTNAMCRILAKTSSNFVYQIDYFKLRDITSDDSKEKMVENQKNKIIFNIG